jgi:hypothetical protein
MHSYVLNRTTQRAFAIMAFNSTPPRSNDSQMTGDLSNDQETLSTLFKIFVESPGVLDEEAPRRVAVSFPDYNFVMTAADKFIYIVKTCAT